MLKLVRDSRKLEFGCGGKLKEGFTGVDIRSFPGVRYKCQAWEIVKYVSRASIEEIYSRHFFEHLTFSQADKTLRAWHWILKPGGKLQIIVPDIRYHIKQFLEPPLKRSEDPLWTVREHAIAGFWGWQRENEITQVWDVHKSGYDYNLLRESLQKQGFCNIRRLEDHPWNLYVQCSKEEGVLGGHLNITHIDKGTLQYLIDKFKIKTMVDVGCGPGGMVKVAKKKGITAIGIDGDSSVNPTIVHDFRTGPLDILETDLAWSVEFLEHIGEKYLDNVFSVFNKCKYVFCTHNERPGPYHMNCQPMSYWVDIFGSRDFVYDILTTKEIKKHSTMEREFVQKTGTFFRNQERVNN